MPRVLVVDDEPGVAAILATILEDAGYQVATAIDGQQGLRQLAQTPADAVFLDFMMPVLDGPGMFQSMRAQPAWKAIPVIVMSSLPEDAIAARLRGHAAFLRKPFRVSLVLQTLERALRQPRP